MKLVREQHKADRLVVVVGPTASGKSALAMDLAQKYNGEIVCADSRTVYKGFDIGTAKPTQEDRALVPHHLLDVCEPGDDFSAARFKDLAQEAIEGIWSRGKVAFLVGGSGMYVDSVIFDYKFRKAALKPGRSLSELPTKDLMALAEESYPEEFSTIELGNRRRLEQFIDRGPASSEDRLSLKYDCLIIGINTDRLYLKQNIANRIDSMLSNGFVHEVETLISRYGHDCPQLNIIGYRHARDYIDGLISLVELKSRFARDDMALAKRQVTWFRRNHFINWLEKGQTGEALVSDYMS